MDVILPVLGGEVRAELRLRVVSSSEPATARLLAHLGLCLPKGPRIATKCSTENSPINISSLL